MLRTSVVCLLAVLLVSAAPVSAQEQKPADGAKKLNYAEHVQSIFREHCYTCHNTEQAKGGLALDSFAATMKGGSGGEVVFPGDLESSRLWALVAHIESPKMPPEQDKLPDAKLNVIKQWILDGALDNANSKIKTQKKPALELQVGGGSQKPAGPPPMPVGLTHEPFVVTQRPGAITALAASPWAPLLAVGGQRQVLLYHSETAELLGVLPFQEGTPYVLKFSRSGTVLLVGGGRGGQSGKVVLFDVKTGKRLAEVGDELDVVLAADVNDDLSIVALGGPRKLVKLFYVADGSEVCPPLRKHTDWIYSIEFSPDGVLLATSDRSGGLVVWEGDSGREFHNLTGHKAGVTDVSWRSDSNALASASEDGNVKIWEMDNGKEIRSFQGSDGLGVLGVRFAKDGKLATVGRNKKLHWFAPDGKLIKAYAGYADFTTEVAVTFDGKRLVGGDLLGELRVFDAEGDKQVAQLSANPLPLDALIAQEVEKAAAAEKLVADSKTAEQSAQAALSTLKAANDKLAAVAAEITKAEATLAQAKQQAEKLAAANKPATDKFAALKTAADKAKLEADDAAKLAAQKAAAAKVAADQLAAGKSELDKLALDKTAADKLLQDATATVEQAKKKLATDKTAADKLAADKAAIEKRAADAAAATKNAQEQASAAKLRLERLKAEKAATDKNRTAQTSAAKP